jgi:putative transposase
MSEIRQAYPFGVRAFVLLPDHIHCIWELPGGDNDYSLRWGLIKKEFTKRTKDWLNVAMPSASRLKHRESGVWQRRFWEHRIRDEEDFRAHFDYIHYNPVKHGLAGSAGEWEHSTFQAYVKAGVYPAHWGCTPPGLPEQMGGE